MARALGSRRFSGCLSIEGRWVVSAERLERYDDASALYGCEGIGDDFPEGGTHVELTIEDDAQRYTVYRAAERLLDELRDA